MELLRNLFEGYPNLWGGGVAHSVLILSLVITFGIMLGKLKVAGISLGVTWILFVGIVFGHFDMNLDEHLLHFLKEFGLILFVYSIGLQVGPGFFSAFKKGGLTLNMVAMLSVFLSVLITIVLHFATGIPITTMVGILSGAVTNTPVWVLPSRQTVTSTGWMLRKSHSDMPLPIRWGGGLHPGAASLEDFHAD